MGMPWRTLKAAIDLRARVTAAFWPVMRPRSSLPTSTIFAFCVASPRPMFTTTLVILGTAITFL